MTDKKDNDAKLIAKYRAGMAARRRNNGSKTKSEPSTHSENGVITVFFATNAKPISALGGVAKVLGRSRISIPEYKLRSR